MCHTCLYTHKYRACHTALCNKTPEKQSTATNHHTFNNNPPQFPGRKRKIGRVLFGLLLFNCTWVTSDISKQTPHMSEETYQEETGRFH